MSHHPALETFSEGELHAALAAIRPPQTDAYASSLRASVRRSLFGPTSEPFRLGRFTVQGPLHGGMGVTFVAHDPDLQRKVALKVLRSRDERGRDELLRGAQALARLRHPNVVAVHEVSVRHDDVLVAMEYVEGTQLRAWLRAPRSAAEILARLIEAGRGLAAAHALGLVHGDFQPDSVVIDAHGHARVIDFCLARPSAEPPATPAYAAPERLAGVTGDHRSDQYAFALTCWEALLRARPTARAPHARDVPRWLLKVLSRGLSPAPDDRHPTTEAMLAALQADPTPRRRALAGVALAALALAGWFACAAERPSIDGVVYPWTTAPP